MLGQGYVWNIAFIGGILVLIFAGVLEFAALVGQSRNTGKFTKIAGKITQNIFFRKLLFGVIAVWLISIGFTILENRESNGFRTQQNHRVSIYHHVQKISKDDRSVYLTVKNQKKQSTLKLMSHNKIELKTYPQAQNKLKHTEITYIPKNDEFSRAFFILPFNHSSGPKQLSYLQMTSSNSLKWWHQQKIKKPQD